MCYCDVIVKTISWGVEDNIDNKDNAEMTVVHDLYIFSADNIENDYHLSLFNFSPSTVRIHLCSMS